MRSLAAAGFVFAITAGFGIGGLILGGRLPQTLRDESSRDAVRHIASFVATLSALVLGLFIASAKTNFDERSSQLHRLSAGVIALDRALIRFGSGADQTRAILYAGLVDQLERISPKNKPIQRELSQPVYDTRLLAFHDTVQALVPQTDAQRAARDRATQLADDLAGIRVLLTQSADGSIPAPFLAILTFWLAAMFASFAMFARINAIVVTALLVGAVSVSSAVFLILELDRPLEGIMHLSTDSLRHAVELLAR